MSAGKSSPPPSPCAFGVPREQCHNNCGYVCQRWKREQSVAPDLMAALAESLKRPRPAVCCGACDLPPGHKPCTPVDSQT